MSVRLVISIAAVPGKGAELAKAMAARCRESQKDAGCEQFEVFRARSTPTDCVCFESGRAAEDLAAHAKLNQAARRRCPRGCASVVASARITSTIAPAETHRAALP